MLCGMYEEKVPTIKKLHIKSSSNLSAYPLAIRRAAKKVTFIADLRTNMRECVCILPIHTAFATNGGPRVRGPQILIRAPGLTNLGDCLSPTTTVTLRMIYFTTLWNHVYSSYSHNLVEVQELTYKSHFQPTLTAMCPLLMTWLGW